MLGDCREALIQHELQGIVVSAYQEGVSPEIRSSVSNSLDQANELAFIRGHLEVTLGELLAEERNGSLALV